MVDNDINRHGLCHVMDLIQPKLSNVCSIVCMITLYLVIGGWYTYVTYVILEHYSGLGTYDSQYRYNYG